MKEHIYSGAGFLYRHRIVATIITLVALVILSLLAVDAVAKAKSAVELELATVKENNKPVQHCGLGSEVLVAPVQTMMDAVSHQVPFEEMLYQFDGDLVAIKLPGNLTQEQGELLIYAYKIAEKHGHRNPAILQGLIWQESHAGDFKGHEVAGDEYGLKVGKRYYGVGQIKVNAAKDVFRRFHKEFPTFYQPAVVKRNDKGKIIKVIKRGKYLVDDEYIIAHLIIDKKFNIRVASRYLWIMGHNEKRNYVRPTDFAVTAYNRGIGGAIGSDYKKWHYTVSVNKYVKGRMATFNKANKKYIQ